MPVIGLPKTLEISLSSILDDYNVSSWNIKVDKKGTQFCIRFKLLMLYCFYIVMASLQMILELQTSWFVRKEPKLPILEILGVLLVIDVSKQLEQF